MLNVKLGQVSNIFIKSFNQYKTLESSDQVHGQCAFFFFLHSRGNVECYCI
jgi:hypothetical protein